MGAISAFSTAGNVLKRNGVLFGAAFVVAFANAASTGATSLLPPSVAGVLSLPLAVFTLLLTPFFMGGLLAMGEEGLDGPTRFGTFVEGGKANYLHLLGAVVLFSVLLAVIAFVVVIAVAIVGVFVLGVSTAGASSPSAAGGSLAVVALLGLVGVLVLALPVFFLQFYGPAIVVSDLGIVGAFEKSARLVRRNVVSTLGYSAVAALVGIVAGVVGVGITVVGGLSGTAATTGVTSPDFGLGILVAAAVVTIAVSTVVSAFGSVYQVAFYDDRLDSLE